VSCGQTKVTELPIPLKGITDKTYSEEQETQINKVENGLYPYNKGKIETTWSIFERMEFYKVPAVSIAVINDYKVDWAKAYGWADKENQIRATPQTLFQAASVSKSINALGVLHWAEENKIDINADVNYYLKSWKLEDSKKTNNDKVSIANLLSHTAGVSVNGFDGYEVGDKTPSTKQILDGKNPANSRKVKSNAEPNKEFKYSGGGIVITQMVLEDNVDIAYDDYMKKKILNPLGMMTSSFELPNSKNQLATGYWGKGNPLRGKYQIHPEMSAAGLWTNPTELSKYIIEVQKSFNGESNKLLSQSMTKKMLSSYLQDGNTGLGVFIEYINDNKYFSHGGDNQGFKSYYYGSVEGGRGLVIMINSDNFNIVPEIINSVKKAYQW